MKFTDELDNDELDYGKFEDDSRHFLEILASQAIYDILNENEIEKCIDNISK